MAFFLTNLYNTAEKPREIAYLDLPAAGTDLLDKITFYRISIVKNLGKHQQYARCSVLTIYHHQIYADHPLSNNKLDHPPHRLHTRINLAFLLLGIEHKENNVSF